MALLKVKNEKVGILFFYVTYEEYYLYCIA
jgi:hypothetical protein